MPTEKSAATPAAPGAFAGFGEKSRSVPPLPAPLRRRVLAGLGAVLGGVAVLGLSACAGTPLRPEAPEVKLSSVRPVQIGLFEQKLAVGLTLKNPNSFGFRILSLRYQIEINGSLFAQGQLQQKIDVPASGEAQLEVPVTASLTGLLPIILDTLATGRPLHYRVHGAVEVDNWGEIPFDRKGDWAPGKDAPLPGGAQKV